MESPVEGTRSREEVEKAVRKVMVARHRPIWSPFPNAVYVSEHGLWLPSSSFLERSQVEYICEKIRRYYNGER